MKYDDERYGSGGAGGPNSNSQMRKEGRWFPVCRKCHEPATRKITGPNGRRNFFCNRCGPQNPARWNDLEPLALRDAIRPTLPPPPAPLVPHRQQREPMVGEDHRTGRASLFDPTPPKAEIADTGNAMFKVRRALDDLALENSRLREQVVALEVERDRLAEQVEGWEGLADQITRPDGRGESA